jgi:hypothetical protein
MNKTKQKQFEARLAALEREPTTCQITLGSGGSVTVVCQSLSVAVRTARKLRLEELRRQRQMRGEKFQPAYL